jgi:hypothetical protein
MTLCVVQSSRLLPGAPAVTWHSGSERAEVCAWAEKELMPLAGSWER